MNGDSLFSPSMSLRVRLSSDANCTISPWASLGNVAGVSKPDWWDAYNSLKHDRFNNEERGTLQNLLNALGGLYIINMIFAKTIGDHWYTASGKVPSDDSIDVPNDVSRVFELEHWSTRDQVVGYGQYSCSQDDMKELLGRP